MNNHLDILEKEQKIGDASLLIKYLKDYERTKNRKKGKEIRVFLLEQLPIGWGFPSNCDAEIKFTGIDNYEIKLDILKGGKSINNVYITPNNGGKLSLIHISEPTRPY